MREAMATIRTGPPSLWWPDQPGDSLDRDDPADDQQRDAVASCRQDLSPLPAERPGSGRWAGGSRICPQRPGDRADVRQHVPGVRQQRERTGGERDDDLTQHESAQETRGDDQVTAVGICAQTVRVPVPWLMGLVVPGLDAPP